VALRTEAVDPRDLGRFLDGTMARGSAKQSVLNVFCKHRNIQNDRRPGQAWEDGGGDVFLPWLESIDTAFVEANKG